MGALSGQPQRLDFAASLNPDCVPNGPITHTLKAGPTHGSVAFRTVSDFVAFPTFSPRAKCNDHRVEGAEVLYTSAPGFRGSDEFTASTLFPDGA